jgi:hypothetical protein
MAAPVIVSRVRATLHRQGYQGITQEQILEAANSLNIDANSPTADDTKAVANHLIELSSANSELAPQPEQSSQAINQSMLDSLPRSDSSTAITEIQKNNLVATQADLMGITLSDSDIQNISQQIDFQNTDSIDLIDEIKSFLVAFIHHRKNQNQAKLSNALAEVVQASNQANKEVSDSLSNGLRNIASQMEEQRNHFKSSVRTALRHLAIPESEAQR